MSMIQEPSNQLDGNRWESWRNPWWLQSYFCNWMVKIPSIAEDTGLGITYCMSTSNTHNIRQWILWVWNLGFLSITICFSLPSLRIIRLFLSWSSSSFSWLPFFLWFCGCTVMSVRTENVSFMCLPTISPILSSFWYSKKVLNHSFHLLDILVTKMENRHSHCPQNGTQHHCTNKQTHNYCSWYLWCWMGLQKQGRSGHWIGFAVGRGGRGFLSEFTRQGPIGLPLPRQNVKPEWVIYFIPPYSIETQRRQKHIIFLPTLAATADTMAQFHNIRCALQLL